MARLHGQDVARGRQNHLQDFPLTRTNGTRATPNRSHTTSCESYLQPNLGVTPLLTPPEDCDSVKWNAGAQRQPTRNAKSTKHMATESPVVAETYVQAAASDSANAAETRRSKVDVSQTHLAPSMQSPQESAAATSGRVMGTWLEDGVTSTGKLSKSCGLFNPG